MKKRILVPLALLALTALALSACGGGGSSAEGEIAETLEKVATTSDASNCTELHTQRFDEQNSGATGRQAIEACEEDAEKGEEHAKTANVSNVSVDGEKATADVEFEGGPFDSQTLEVALLEEDGKWKLDQIEGFADYDGKALEEEFLKKFEENPEGLSKKQYTCIAEGIGKASETQAKELFLSGSPAKVEELAEGCI